MKTISKLQIDPRSAGKMILDSIDPAHVIFTLTLEHDKLLTVLEGLEQERKTLLSKEIDDISEEDLIAVQEYAEMLVESESHHLREEKGVFSVLRSLGIKSPTDAMELEHKAIVDYKNKLLETINSFSMMSIRDFLARLDFFSKSIIYILTDHISRENIDLFPMALKVINEKTQWAKIKKRCDEVGYCSFTFDK